MLGEPQRRHSNECYDSTENRQSGELGQGTRVPEDERGSEGNQISSDMGRKKPVKCEEAGSIEITGAEAQQQR